MLSLEQENSKPIKYGELIVLGCNGSFPGGDHRRRKSRFSLYRRATANGVKPGTVHIANSPEAAKVISKNSQHSVSYTLTCAETVVVEYTDDDESDMFQIGRAIESPIDFVVAKPELSSHGNDNSGVHQSTISRFACRIACDRAPPYTARLYAAGFDGSRNIFLGENAAKWRSSDGQMDGLTTNGVLVMQPPRGFSVSADPSVWREISVCGNVYTLRETRSSQKRGEQVMDESPVLVDGSLIDLCGVTLLWRSTAALSYSPGPEHMEALRMELNAARPHCPVLLHTLAFPSMDESDSLQPGRPWAYLCCGHVHGFHPWRGRRKGVKEEAEEEKEDEDKDVKGAREGDRDKDRSRDRECPLCRAQGLYVALTLGREARLCVDKAPPSHAFVPCGHVCSEATAEYWSKTPLPSGANGFHTACPFCTRQLAHDKPHVRLIFTGAPD